MPQLTLTEEEAAALGDVLSSFLSDLRVEIHHTDQHDFREELKQTEAMLKRVLGQLTSPTVS